MDYIFRLNYGTKSLINEKYISHKNHILSPFKMLEPKNLFTYVELLNKFPLK